MKRKILCGLIITQVLSASCTVNDNFLDPFLGVMENETMNIKDNRFGGNEVGYMLEGFDIKDVTPRPTRSINNDFGDYDSAVPGMFPWSGDSSILSQEEAVNAQGVKPSEYATNGTMGRWNFTRKTVPFEFPYRNLTQGVYLTSFFGWRVRGSSQEFHNAIDLQAKANNVSPAWTSEDEGPKIYSIADGTVVFAGEYSSYGNLVLIQHNILNQDDDVIFLSKLRDTRDTSFLNDFRKILREKYNAESELVQTTHIKRQIAENIFKIQGLANSKEAVLCDKSLMLLSLIHLYYSVTVDCFTNNVSKASDNDSQYDSLVDYYLGFLTGKTREVVIGIKEAVKSLDSSYTAVSDKALVIEAFERLPKKSHYWVEENLATLTFGMLPFEKEADAALILGEIIKEVVGEDDSEASYTVVSMYAHLNTLNAAEGDKIEVNKDNEIYLGTEGGSSAVNGVLNKNAFGRHLHFGVTTGVPANIMNFITLYSSQGFKAGEVAEKMNNNKIFLAEPLTRLYNLKQNDVAAIKMTLGMSLDLSASTANPGNITEAAKLDNIAFGANYFEWRN